MISDKQVKSDFKIIASKSPDKYYATSVLKNEGFTRHNCKNCGTFFWSINITDVCGDPSCSGGFRFINKKVTSETLDYIEVWKKFSKLFKKWGYTPIDRYPVTARWRADTEFVQASIYDFQPYVVSGEVDPPANPLVVPQFCLRFNDIDNVGITGAHYTGFVMIGQHAFMPPEEWDQDKYFTDIHNWQIQGLGLNKKDITYHEDAWAGGGNFGPCMEYFSHGLELGNQVYMLYEQTPAGNRELKLKVLDMGAGHERFAWFTQGNSTSYETTFPTVCKKLFNITGINVDKDMMQKFLPFSSYLNVDEVEDINKTWRLVANKVNIDTEELKAKVLPLSAIYSIAEHSRSLLFALNDGALPSNVGGGYNLRVILRRALTFIEKYKWEISLGDLAELHANYLKKIFPELKDNLHEVKQVLEIEEKKFNLSREKSRDLVKKIITEEIKDKKLIELYDTQGINPEIIREEAKKIGKIIKIPDNFYSLVSELHTLKEQVTATRKKEIPGIGNIDTKPLYYDNYLNLKSSGTVVKIINNNVILDRTVAYPTSGGQIHDIGTLDGQEFIDVLKQGKSIVHVLSEKPKFKEGQIVEITIDVNRRRQLAQHHTATHIVNAATRTVLGNHINQAGARKNIDKASIDITHYQSINSSEINKIEKLANSIINKNINVESKFYPRTLAEKKFSMRIYQGGVIPGDKLRIVNIKNIDVEACGGTHLHNTKEAEKIKIIKTTKISDSIVRITFTAGSAANKLEDKDKEIINQAASLLHCDPDQIPGRSLELFRVWKDIVKKKKVSDHKNLTSTEKYKGDIISKTAENLKTQPEHIIKTIKRFKHDLKI